MQIVDKVIAALAPSDEAAPRPEGYSRMFAASFVGVGLYWAWLFSTSLGSDFAPASSGVVGDMPWFYGLLSFAGYIGVLVILLLANERVRVAVSSEKAVGAASALAAACTVLLALFHAFGVASISIFVPFALVLTGLCTGVFLVAWGMWFACHIAYAAAQLACALVVSGLAYALVAFLPAAAYVVTVSLLPLGFGAAYIVSLRTACAIGDCGRSSASRPDGFQNANEPAHAHALMTSLRAAFPWHACLALTSVGLVTSLLHGLSPYIMGTFGDVMPAYAACAIAIGVVIAIYTSCTHRNFGFSAAGSAIVPLAVSGLLLFAMFHERAYLPAFLLIRLAYVLLDALMWLQLSKVLAVTGSIRSFLVSRLALSVGELVGALLFGIMGVSPDVRPVYDAVLVACGILLTCVFSFAVLKGGIENAWGLVQPAAGRGQRLADAVEAAAENFKLTKREREVAVLMMRGKSGPYIEEKLCISANTFQTHTRNIYRKMDVHSRSEMEQVIDSFLI